MTAPNRDEKTYAFVDSASLHDAFVSLRVGQKHWLPWTQDCLIDVTYLLLFRNTQIVAGPGHTGGNAVPGDEYELVKQLPVLTGPPAKKTVEKRLVEWLGDQGSVVAEAWQKTIANPQFEGWADLRRNFIWPRYIQANEGLFNHAHIPTLSNVLNVPESDLRRIHDLTKKRDWVKHWAVRKGGEDQKIADLAHISSGLIRGKFHEFMARSSKAQLKAHPFRAAIADTASKQITFPTSKSADYLVRILIASSLLERDKIKVQTWQRHIVAIRERLSRGVITLPDLPETLAIDLATKIAKDIGISPRSQWRRRTLSATLDNTLAVGLFTIAPWAGVTYKVASIAHKLGRGQSLTDSIANADFDHDYHQLAKSVPGRISRFS